VLDAVKASADTASRRTMPVNRTLYLAAAAAALLNVSILEPATAAPVSSMQPSGPKAVSMQHTGSTTMTNGMLTPRMMDRKRPMNPICAQAFKPHAPSSCHY
jgi:hypothetical protein